MLDNKEIDDSSYTSIGGDFANVFDNSDYIALINSTDTAGIILRTHLILEDFINIWCSKITGTEDLFDGPLIAFKAKLNISKNLGLDKQFYDVLDKFNTIRNRYSHRRQYLLEESSLDSLCTSIDMLPPTEKILSCQKFSIFISGTNTSTGEKVQQEYQYKEADLNKKIIIIFIVLVMKLLIWMQSEFVRRGISYTIISDLPVPTTT